VDGVFEYRAYDQVSSPPMTPALAEACVRAVHVIRNDGQILRAGRAVLYVYSRLGWPRTTALLARRPMIWLIELLYRLVVRHRRFFALFMFRRE
jgi:predicted DCC family thiol-disulfide oxidoreductase YuxK